MLSLALGKLRTAGGPLCWVICNECTWISLFSSKNVVWHCNPQYKQYLKKYQHLQQIRACCFKGELFMAFPKVHCNLRLRNSLRMKIPYSNLSHFNFRIHIFKKWKETRPTLQEPWPPPPPQLTVMTWKRLKRIRSSCKRSCRIPQHSAALVY